MKKTLLAVMAVLMMSVMLIAGAGCSSGEEAAPAAKKDGATTIGFSISTLNNPFFVSVKDGVEAKAKELGVKVKIVDAQNDPAKQANDVADLLQQGVTVLLVNPVDSAAISTSVEAANKAKMAAEYIINKLGEGVKVAELEGIPGASATRERGEGFHKVADQKLNVVAKQSADFDRTKGLTVAENMLQANPDIQAIFAQNDEMALGAIEASKSAGKQIFIVGFDGTDDGIKAVENGTMAATIAQQPELMGQQGVEAAVKLAKGEKIEAKIAVPLKLVEKK